MQNRGRPVAGRRLGPLVTAVAIFSSVMSGFAFVGGPGLVYHSGMSSIWILITGVMGSCLVATLIGKRLRLFAEVRATLSLPDVLAARYGSELTRLLAALQEAGGAALVTADHGNADCMWTEKDGRRTPMVAHTRNPVPCIIKDFSGRNDFALSKTANPGLSNVAATICNLLGYEAPAEYDPSLITL